MEQVDCLVIGAGAVGLAIARALGSDREVIVAERHPGPGQETSSRNSGVIHAGLYYPGHFLKTRLCIEGRQALYRYCEQHAINHQRCGKLVVACTPEEIPPLRALHAQALANGINDLQWLEQAALQQREPQVQGCAALLSPSTGIIDSQAYIQQLASDIEGQGGHIAYRQTVTAISKTASGFVLSLNHNDHIHCQTLVNAAGLEAQQLAAQLCPPDSIPTRQLARGHYYQYQAASPFRHLVYPLPVARNAGLGIHATLDLSGRLRFGPDVEIIETVDYQFNSSNKAAFLQSIRRYFPDVDADKLQPDFTGIRPKIDAGSGVQDFIIQDATNHGIANYVQLFGIESPGLTASLAIAGHVRQQLSR